MGWHGVTMKNHTFSVQLSSVDDTAQWAARFGAVLRPGDVILMTGDIGAGKSFLARSIIQSHQSTPEDVPSPTFTLVQTYDTYLGEIWHADLYRLSGPDDVIELGLYDAFDTAICLIEWPDRLQDLTPQTALNIAFSVGQAEDARTLTITAPNQDWRVRLEQVCSQ